MKAIVITEPGEPAVLQMQERPIPACGPGEVLIQVKAAGLNRPDVAQRRGLYPPPPGASIDIPGLEVSGIIQEGKLKTGTGKKVTSRKQAIAIGLSEARKAGAKVPDKK